jgi:hypothetical protein
MDLTTYSREKVEALLQAALANPQALFEPELRHFFTPGIYAREMYMPKGSVVVGKLHLKDHLCTVLGDVSVYSPDGVTRYEGYHTFETKAGAQRTLVAHDATWWTTYHANPDDERNIETLEARNAAAPGGIEWTKLETLS